MAEALQQLILDTLHSHSTIPDTRSLVIPGQSEPAASQDAQIAVLGALNSLLSRDMVKFETHEIVSHVLTPEGSQIAVQGSHEARVWSALPAKGEGAPVTPVQLKKQVGDETAKVGQGRAFKNGWIGKEGDGLVKLGQWFTVQKGPDFSTSTAKPETDLTVDMLTSGAWKTSTFKKYNFEAEGSSNGRWFFTSPAQSKRRNPQHLLGNGSESFAEMPTASFVESGFWCFDALFVPQQHPARDLQDTFYISDPPHSLHPEPEYYKRVSTVHEHGGFGSTGYRAPWSHEETTKLLLRTHTTASSAHMLYKLAAKCRGEDVEDDRPAAGKEGKKDDGFRPAKLFSIDRVFRNETTDATHLAEFHQVEGVVADRGLTLADLIGFMKVFFSKMGIKQVRFKPAYNPYTEPSLEIFAFHPMLDRWVEVGNSGMFRPEMLEPMGFPKDVRVHGWGIGLERPTMIRYGINNIRTLMGHKTSIEYIEDSPAPML
ncbi:Phenylalanyl-tRNA synthetase alpha chain [Mycena venus]|uniref:phenylalanine--tRNA ligase n=1 Tax=Mycena venus TaxID=2733690 RepID=A0A8H6Y592_9AGAR|nr:Phenylalanyl-tRNA synthetase alpha chain [Mycena venus]